MLKEISILLLISISYQTFKNINSKFSIRNLSEKSLNSNENVNFENISTDAKYLFIWPENCQLSTNNSNANNNIKFIQIQLENQTSLNLFIKIEKKYDNNPLCRFNYDYYKNNLILKENVNYGFNAGDFIFTFSSSENTNPVYYLYFNKNGTGNLNISISSEEENVKKNITLTNNNPYKIFFINRENLFSKCADKEPYKCSIIITISGKDIPFTLLIKNSHDNIPTYFIPNEMIFGIGESFSPVFFYTEIPYKSEGEVFINYQKGGTIAIGKIVNKEKNDSNGKIEQNNESNLKYDFYNKKFNNINCESGNGCFLYVGIYVSDFKVDDPSDFSFFFRFTDLVNKGAVNIFVNEFVFGNVNPRNDIYNITINKNISSFNLIFDSEYCNLTAKLNDEEIKLNGDDKFYSYDLNNSDEDQILSLNITQRYNTVIKSPFYSLKVFINESTNIQLIRSEHMEYCNIEISDPCYFAYPIIDNKTITQVSFYAFNEDNPMEVDISTTEIDIYSDLSEISEKEFNNTSKNLLIHNITKNEIYIIVKLNMSKSCGIITLLTNTYPIYEKKTLIPNSVNLFHFPSTHNYLNYILLNGSNLQSYNFLNISGQNIINFPTDSQNRTLTNENYLFNIYPNKELDKSNNNKNIINYAQNGDYLLSTKTSSNNIINSFKLNINDKPHLILKKYNINYLPILMYIKKPKSINNDIKIPINLNSLSDNDNLKNIFSIQCGLISEDNLLQYELKNILNYDDTNDILNITCSNYELTIEDSHIKNYSNLKYIFINLYKRDLNITYQTNEFILYSVLIESSTIQTKINSSKTTGFLFERGESKKTIFKINFFLPYNFNFFYHFKDDNYITSDEEIKKTNSSLPLIKYNFRRRFIYLIESSHDLIFYFYNSNQRRFLADSTNTLIPITLKYELLNASYIYHIKNKIILIVTNSTTLDKNITIYPLVNENGTKIEKVEYSILLYNSSLSEEKIDSLDNPQLPLLEITNYKINDNNEETMSFIINKNNLNANFCKLTAIAIVNEDEIVNYNIYTIDMESNNTDINNINNNNNNNNANPINYFVKKNNDKKSKWWIALIVIGILLIIIIIVIVCLKMKKNKNTNKNTNENNEKMNTDETRKDTQEILKNFDN